MIATGDLRAVPRALRLGRATLTAIRQNLLWAFLYNVLGIPLAAAGQFGQYGPMIAALAMSLSSVTVVARSAMLARARPRWSQRAGIDVRGLREPSLPTTSRESRALL